MAALTADPRALRPAGALMLAAAVVRPMVPDAPGIPCPLRTMTGIPCPFCGMTTSVTAAVHLDVGGALAANPVGLVAVAVAILVLVVRRPLSLDVPRWGLLALFASMWLFELQRFDVV